LFWNILFAFRKAFPKHLFFAYGYAISGEFFGYEMVIAEANVILLFYSFSHFYFIVLVLVCMKDDYFNKISDEVDMDMDDTVKNEDCNNFFKTTKVIISSL